MIKCPLRCSFNSPVGCCCPIASSLCPLTSWIHHSFRKCDVQEGKKGGSIKNYVSKLHCQLLCRLQFTDSNVQKIRCRDLLLQRGGWHAAGGHRSALNAGRLQRGHGLCARGGRSTSWATRAPPRLLSHEQKQFSCTCCCLLLTATAGLRGGFGCALCEHRYLIKHD